jgi:hypothetical protein
LITYVCTTPWRAIGSSTNFELPQLMQCGWIDGGVLIVPQSTHRAPSRPRISSAPRTSCALSGGTPIGTVSPVGTSTLRARSTSA